MSDGKITVTKDPKTGEYVAVHTITTYAKDWSTTVTNAQLNPAVLSVDFKPSYILVNGEKFCKCKE